MTSRDFCYWLQGYFEVNDAADGQKTLTHKSLTPTQVETIKKHLAMVFHHEIDPSFGKDNDALNKIHNHLRPPDGTKIRC